VQGFEPASRQVVVTAMGTVTPARSVKLEARVAGEVIALHPEFTDGGFVHAGDLLVRLEDNDYQLILAQRRSDLVNAEYALALEEGRQQVARREWELLNDGTPEAEADLALRKPHLDKARADVAAAEAAVRKAGLDKERTRIRAPFNAIVRSRSVEVGSQVSPQETLAELVGTDLYWIQATLSVDRLEWVFIPRRAGQNGSVAHIRYNGHHTIEGRVVRLLGDLTDGGRMARLLIEVDDPLGLASKTASDRPPLLIGDYVRVEIEGRRLDGVFAVPRTVLRDNDTVWLVDDAGKLEIRKVTPVWRDAETVLLRDHLKAGDRLVVSDLSAPVEGMELRVETGGADRAPRVGGDAKAP
jgi:RND family efflux transporter MFP subunit